MASIPDSKSVHRVQISVDPEMIRAARTLADSVEVALKNARALLDLVEQTGQPEPEGEPQPVCALGDPAPFPPWHPEKQPNDSTRHP
jgi:hypothetical protein